jgi:endonuclease YncB( thermonuclease family)
MQGFSRIAWLPALALVLAGPAQAQFRIAPPRGAVACAAPTSASGLTGVAVVAVSDEGEIEVADGRRLRAAGLDLGRDHLGVEAWAGQRRRLAEALVGRTVIPRLLGSETDRWGRIPALLFEPAAGAAAATPLAERLVAAGLARTRVGDRVDHCLSSWLKAETAARTAKSGLWALPETGLVAATDERALRAAAGRYAVIEGVVTSVGSRTQRTFLNFGRRFNRDFAAVVPKTMVTRFRSAGLDMKDLRNKRVRLRGVVTVWRAPRLSIANLADIEIVEDNRGL